MSRQRASCIREALSACTRTWPLNRAWTGVRRGAVIQVQVSAYRLRSLYETDLRSTSVTAWGRAEEVLLTAEHVTAAPRGSDRSVAASRAVDLGRRRGPLAHLAGSRE